MAWQWRAQDPDAARWLQHLDITANCALTSAGVVQMEARLAATAASASTASSTAGYTTPRASDAAAAASAGSSAHSSISSPAPPGSNTPLRAYLARLTEQQEMLVSHKAQMDEELAALEARMQALSGSQQVSFAIASILLLFSLLSRLAA